MRAVDRPAPRSVVNVGVWVVVRGTMSKSAKALRVKRRSVGIGVTREGGGEGNGARATATTHTQRLELVAEAGRRSPLCMKAVLGPVGWRACMLWLGAHERGKEEEGKRRAATATASPRGLSRNNKFDSPVQSRPFSYNCPYCLFHHHAAHTTPTTHNIHSTQGSHG